MKRKINYKIIMPVAAALALVSYACSKTFLDRPAIGQISPAAASNRAGVEALLIGAYSMLDGFDPNFGATDGPWTATASNWIFGQVCADDSHKGSDPGDQPDIVPLMTWSENPSNNMVLGKWQTLYDAIQRCNATISQMRLATDMSAQDTVQVKSEALFLRGLFSFENKKMFNNGAPYIDENITYIAGNWRVPNQIETWPGIEADFKYAMDNLPTTQTQGGRANKYAAEAFLAKAYLYQHKYADAKPLFDDLIANGQTSLGHPYKLINFADNFNPGTNHLDDEAVFQAQMSVNDNGSAANANAGDVLNFPYNGGPGTCCGFNQPSFSLVNTFKTDPATGLPDPAHYNDVDLKNDQNLTASDPFTPTTATVDARLDWTVGRRGVPYLDWGRFPGASWIRNQASAGPYAAMKNVYYKHQEKVLTDNSSWTNGYTANNYSYMRYADVLLMAAEAEVELGNLETARDYVNRVRARAADNSGWVKADTAAGAPNYGGFAANYKVGLYTAVWTNPDDARTAVRFERRIELAMEGHRFFDLVRYGTAATELNAYAAHETSSGYTLMNGATFTASKNEFYPVPQSEIDKSFDKGAATLKQNPGY